ncbi:hypothetical protein IWQ56_005171 [Coemansia nantahalensis]|nr:hypothetical protein IWQ56_005171 [Coemansia nantahalensis]
MLKDFGLADDKVGSHWDKGRECLVNGYRDYHRALSQHGWTGIRRCISTRDIEGEAASGCPSVLVRGPAVVDFAVTWRALQEYLQTWSALHRYHKEHPDRENLAKVVVREMMAASGATDMDEALSIEWEEIALMCHPPRTHVDE